MKTAHRVSGLMLANHTSIHTLFSRAMSQFDMLKKRNAFIEAYRQTSMFSDGLGEFDDARCGGALRGAQAVRSLRAHPPPSALRRRLLRTRCRRAGKWSRH